MQFLVMMGTAVILNIIASLLHLCKQCNSRQPYIVSCIKKTQLNFLFYFFN